MFYIKSLVLPIFIMLIFNSCNNCEFYGSKNLKNNFYLLAGDGDDENIIIYCTSNDECCNVGISIVPEISNIQREYVSEVGHSDTWITAKTISKNNNNVIYWILDSDKIGRKIDCVAKDCDTVLSKVVVYQSSIKEDFIKKCDELGITEVPLKEVEW